MASTAVVLASALVVPSSAFAATEGATPTPTPTASEPAETQDSVDSTTEPTTTPDSTTAPETTAPTESESTSPEPQNKTNVVEPNANQLDSEDALISPMAVGPDGGTAPYVYWDVRDTDGNLVPGATFRFQYRTDGSWTTGTSADPIADCAASSCAATSLDRDTDGGEWLLTHRGYAAGTNNTNRLSDGSNYRVQQVSPPSGYVWVVSGDNTQTIGAANEINGTWNDQNGNLTHNFGTFTVRKIVTTAVCEPGYVYGVSAAGQLQQVAPNGTVTNVGTSAGTTNFNGLGMSLGGERIYGLQRSDGSGTAQNGTVWVYDTASGVWTSTGSSTSSLGNNYNTSTNLVGGAVNLLNGLYYFGGFMSNGNFRIFEYDPSKPANSRISLKGTVVTAATTSANGDFAFDAAGNLFVVHGSGTTSTVYSVTSATFLAATGGNMQTSSSNGFTTMGNVNGIAFDSAGKGYLASGTEIRSYNMPGWTGGSTVTSSNYSGTDLASCSSPPTITIEKVVEGGRVNATDQFTLTLNQGSTQIANATTTGNASGVQAQRIGPLPTVRNIPLTFAETAAGGANLANYATSYRCLLDGVQFAEGNATSGSVTIPSGGQEVICQIFNSPLIANVTIHKDVVDANGENSVAKSGWTVGATAAATTGSVTAQPTATTQQTNASGNATWSYRFGGKNHVATVSVREQMQSNYAFVSGVCLVTHLDGTTREVALASASSQGLTGIVPGDKVECTYVNQLLVTNLTLTKDFDINYGAPANAGDWTLTAAPATGSTLQFESGQTQTVTAGNYTLGEFLKGSAAGTETGYDWTSTTCKVTDRHGATSNLAISSSNGITIAAGDRVECTLTNADKPGSVTWQKSDGQGLALDGSEWSITGPNGAIAVIDCTTGDCAAAADKNPTAGQFLVQELAWGDYTLVETKAPPGFQLDETVHEFTISGSALNASFDENMVNEQVPMGELPLTGVFSGAGPWLFGGAGVLALLGTAWLLMRRRDDSSDTLLET